MARRQFDVPNLSNAVIAGALWFVGLGAIGAIAAVSNDPAGIGASLSVMVFGMLGASILLAVLGTVRQPSDTLIFNEKSDTSRIKIQRRGASKAA